MLKYRLELPGFELPEPIRMAQKEFDDRLARILDCMADRMEGKPSERKDDLNVAFERLEHAVRACCSGGPKESLSTELQAFIALSRSITSVTMSLDNDI